MSFANNILLRICPSEKLFATLWHFVLLFVTVLALKNIYICVLCHKSNVTCHMSNVTFHMSVTPTAPPVDSPINKYKKSHGKKCCLMRPNF